MNCFIWRMLGEFGGLLIVVFCQPPGTGSPLPAAGDRLSPASGRGPALPCQPPGTGSPLPAAGDRLWVMVAPVLWVCLFAR